MNALSEAIRGSKRVFGMFGIVATLLVPGLAQAAGPITEFPSATPAFGPGGITAGPDGNVWFSEAFTTWGIGRATPDGAVSDFPTTIAPLGITAGPDGNLWYAGSDFDYGYGGSGIGRITPSGTLTEFPVSHVNGGIAAGPDGNLWFTMDTSIGRITPAGAMNTFPLPGGTASPYAYTIAAGPDDNLWFTQPAMHQIGRMSVSGAVTAFPVPSDMMLGSIVAGPDGNLWVAGDTEIGRMTTDGEFARFPISASALGVGPDHNLWLADRIGNQVGRLAIASGTPAVDLLLRIPTENAVPSGIAAGPDGNVWFSETNGNAIARIDLSAVCAPGGFCLGGRFEIAATWAGGGSSGTGTPMAVTTNAAAFWFFDPANIEVFVKILDDCRGSGKFNVYVNGLTHLGVTVTVTDKRSGTSKSFVHPDGTPFSLLFDGSTFACP